MTSIVLNLLLLFAYNSVNARLSTAARLRQTLNGLQTESLFVDQNDAGIKQCSFAFTMQNPAYPYSPQSLQVDISLQMRYTYWAGNASIKYVVTASTKDVFHAPKEKMAFLQPFTLVQTNQAHSRPPLNHTFEVSAVLESYWDPPNQALMVYGSTTTFRVVQFNTDEAEFAGRGHPQWRLMLGDGRDSGNCSWSPATDMNLIDGRGIFAPPSLDQTPSSTNQATSVAKDREMFVLIKPIQSFTPSVIGPLLFRHVEYYQALGVSKHIVYISKESIKPLLASNPPLLRLVRQGKIILIGWEGGLSGGVKKHPLWGKRYELRLVASHAILALSGLDVNLLQIDIDEYVTTPMAKLQGKSLGEIVNSCSTLQGQDADFSEVRLARFSAVCQDCDHMTPEAFLWGKEAMEQWPDRHPLSFYSLINYAQPEAGRSIAKPSAMRTYYVHSGSVADGFKPALDLSEKCLFVLHATQLLHVSETPDRLRAFYVSDDKWMGSLRYIPRLYLPPEPPPPPPRSN